MSTTIYNGYRLPKGLTLRQLFVWVKDLRKDMEKIAVSEVHQHFYENAVRCFDEEVLIASGLIVPNEKREEYLRARSGSLLSHVQIEADNQRMEKKRQNYRDPLYDTDTSMVVIPDGKRLYAMLYSPQKKITNFFEAVEGIEEYGYWNNSDQPDEISDAAWRTRGKRWDRILGLKGIPSEAGATFQLVQEGVGFGEAISKDTIVADSLTFEDRVQEMTHETNEVVATYPVLKGSYQPFMAHRSALNKGENSIFNENLKKVKQFLPEKISLAWLRLPKEERKALIEQMVLDRQIPEVTSYTSRPRV